MSRATKLVNLPEFAHLFAFDDNPEKVKKEVISLLDLYEKRWWKLTVRQLRGRSDLFSSIVMHTDAIRLGRTHKSFLEPAYKLNGEWSTDSLKNFNKDMFLTKEYDKQSLNGIVDNYFKQVMNYLTQAKGLDAFSTIERMRAFELLEVFLVKTPVLKDGTLNLLAITEFRCQTFVQELLELVKTEIFSQAVMDECENIYDASKHGDKLEFLFSLQYNPQNIQAFSI